MGREATNSMKPHRFALALFLVAALARTVFAHGSLQDRLVLLNRDIAGDPSLPGPYLQRAEVRERSGDLAGAWTDLDIFEALSAGTGSKESRATTRVLRAHLLETLGAVGRAREQLDALLLEDPDDVSGVRARAALLRRTGDLAGAARDFAHAYELSRDLDPDLVLDWIRVMATLGLGEDALVVLDAVEHRFGVIPVLGLERVRIARAIGRYDDALATLDRLESVTPHSALLLATRARTLRDAGRTTEARDSYVAALSTLEQAPLARRSTRAAQSLALELHAEIEALP